MASAIADPPCGPGASLPEEAHVAALARLPRLGPGRLRALLAGRRAAEVWSAVSGGSLPVSALAAAGGRDDPVTLLAAWRRAAEAIDPGTYWQAHLDAGVGVALPTSGAFPPALANDIDPPAVVFWRGDLDHLAGMRVAIVGTRRATRYGLDVAHALGASWPRPGSAWCRAWPWASTGPPTPAPSPPSGAPPIAVVGSGLDRIYPRAHGAAVATGGRARGWC